MAPLFNPPSRLWYNSKIPSSFVCDENGSKVYSFGSDRTGFDFAGEGTKNWINKHYRLIETDCVNA